MSTYLGWSNYATWAVYHCLEEEAANYDYWASRRALLQEETPVEWSNKLADELEVSRSHLFVLAVEEFIQRYENEQLLQQINQAYDDMPLADEEQILQRMRSPHRKLVEGEW